MGCTASVPRSPMAAMPAAETRLADPPGTRLGAVRAPHPFRPGANVRPTRHLDMKAMMLAHPPALAAAVRRWLFRSPRRASESGDNAWFHA
jgi:hypothetical protein